MSPVAQTLVLDSGRHTLHRSRLLRPSVCPSNGRYLLVVGQPAPGSALCVLAAEEAIRWSPYLQLALCRAGRHKRVDLQAHSRCACAADASSECPIVLQYCSICPHSLRPNGNCVQWPVVATRRSEVAAARILHVERCTTSVAGPRLSFFCGLKAARSTAVSLLAWTPVDPPWRP